jgi:adenosine deaminase
MFEGALNRFKQDKVDYCELRFSPFTIVQNMGEDIDVVLHLLEEAIQAACEKTGVNSRLILTLERRNYDGDFAIELYRALKSIATPAFIVGVDVTGDEQFILPKDSASFFRNCKEELGLGLTIHAGETGNYYNIRQAIVDFNADRIGHGIALLKDQQLIDLVLRRNICIELCLQSNYLASNVASLEEHPVHSFIELDIPFLLCTDNPAIHDFSLSQEYELFLKITKREDIIQKMYSRQEQYSFSRS